MRQVESDQGANSKVVPETCHQGSHQSAIVGSFKSHLRSALNRPGSDLIQASQLHNQQGSGTRRSKSRIQHHIVDKQHHPSTAGTSPNSKICHPKVHLKLMIPKSRKKEVAPAEPALTKSKESVEEDRRKVPIALLSMSIPF